MGSCLQKLCFWSIIFGTIYFFGFNNILDFIIRIFEYIPILNYPVSFFLSILKYLYSFMPFYYVYAIIICGLNVFFQVIVADTMFRRNRSKQPIQVFILIFFTFILPTIVNLILINWNLVFFLIVPFQMAALTYHVQLAAHPVDFTTARNFIMFIVLMPILYAPIGFIRYLIGQQIGEVKEIHDL